MTAERIIDDSENGLQSALLRLQRLSKSSVPFGGFRVGLLMTVFLDSVYLVRLL